jgi:hypothetical protein
MPAGTPIMDNQSNKEDRQICLVQRWLDAGSMAREHERGRRSARTTVQLALERLIIPIYQG